LLDEDAKQMAPKTYQQKALANSVVTPNSTYRVQSSKSKRSDSMRSTSSMKSELELLQLKKEEEAEYRDVTFSEIMEYYKPTWLAVAGFVASVFASLSLPLFGFVLSKYIFVLSDYKAVGDNSKTEQDRNDWTLVFIALCFGIGIMAYLQKLFFGRGGENLTYSLRIKLFESFLHKHIGWFDNKNRAPGILTNILTEDISAVNGLTTESLAIAIEAGLGLFFSCLICFIFSWQLGFVVTFTSPFMVLGGLGMSKLQFN
jgi:ABC-type multidrug transport system fused ATPase/permease subunit